MATLSDKAIHALIARAQREGKTLTQAEGSIPGLTLTASKTREGPWPPPQE